MTLPAFSAEASAYASRQHYCSAAFNRAGRFDSIVAQQECRQLGQFCAGLELSCCPGLRCAGKRGGRIGPGTCVQDVCPPCGPCQIDPTAATGCSQACYDPDPFRICIGYHRSCDQSTCCALLKASCIAGGGTITDCSMLSGGCASCPPCCFKCGD